jgi:hypothetical protein
MDLRQLRDLLGAYEIGTWFLISSEHSSFAAGKGFHSRPYVLVRPWRNNHPIAHCRPRSRTNSRGLAHAAHDWGHYPTCHVTESGFIVHELVAVRSSGICHENFSCIEPDETVITAITPRDLR